MRDLSRQVLDEALRCDLATFIHRTMQTVLAGQPYVANWHIEAVAFQLMRVATGENQRLIITLPPRYLKSTCASVAFVAWLLGQDPSLKIVCVSYADDLTSKLALDCRTVMQSSWYRHTFPRTRLARERNRELDFMTTAGGGRYSTTVGGALTGRGGDVIIIDDPLKPNDAMSEAKRGTVNEWFDRTVYTRLDDKRVGSMIIIGQRLHIEDLVGHILAKEQDWEHLNLPAIAEVDEKVRIGLDRFYDRPKGEALHGAREPLAILERLRGDLGGFNFSAQYQQCPVPPDGELIKWSWFRYYTDLGANERDVIVQSWDTACKGTKLSDYSVCTTWRARKGEYYLLDVHRDRMLYPVLKRRVVELAGSFGTKTILIEDAGSGTSLLQDLSYDSLPAVRGVVRIRPEDDKITRMSRQSATIESGRVHLPERAEWLDAFRTELLQFPHGRHDDQVDSMSQFLNWAERDRIRREHMTPPSPPMIFVGGVQIF